ncbi:PqqD family protein [Nonomuraea sp. NPDC049646]|uniref:PqqD family protein n=1 Tax=unclassified Nonomuraea TaxID=2593643 RepID=UPI0037B18740
MPVLHARRGVRCTTADAEGAVLMDTHGDRVYGLNPSAAVIWHALADGADAAAASDIATTALLAGFAIDPATARRDAEAHLALLVGHGLLQERP